MKNFYYLLAGICFAASIPGVALFWFSSDVRSMFTAMIMAFLGVVWSHLGYTYGKAPQRPQQQPTREQQRPQQTPQKNSQNNNNQQKKEKEYNVSKGQSSRHNARSLRIPLEDDEDDEE